MPRGKRAGSKMPTADYDAGCRVRSTSTKCPTRKSRTSSSPPISRPENALASRLLFRQFSKSLAKTCKSGSRKALLHLALESRGSHMTMPIQPDVGSTAGVYERRIRKDRHGSTDRDRSLEETAA